VYLVEQQVHHFLGSVHHNGRLLAHSILFYSVLLQLLFCFCLLLSSDGVMRSIGEFRRAGQCYYTTTLQHSTVEHSTAQQSLSLSHSLAYSLFTILSTLTHSLTCTTRSKQGLQRKHHTNCHENLKCLK
jgi:hypothetical protein